MIHIRAPRLRTGLGALAVVLVAAGPLAACSPRPGVTPTPAATGDTPTPDLTASPESSPSLTDEPTAEPTATPGGSDTVSSTPSADGTPSATSTALITCTEVVPTRIGRITAGSRRTTEVATMVSDGRTLTSGTSEQTEFVTPAVVSPDGARITDAATMSRIASMIDERSNNTVLLDRPESPDSRAEVSRRPFSAAGTYALYNASSPLEVEVVVVCAGQEQRWTFKSEGNPSSGTVNCAVEPARSNIVARLVYQNSC